MFATGKKFYHIFLSTYTNRFKMVIIDQVLHDTKSEHLSERLKAEKIQFEKLCWLGQTMISNEAGYKH